MEEVGKIGSEAVKAVERLQREVEKGRKGKEGIEYKPETRTIVERRKKKKVDYEEIKTVWGIQILDEGFTTIPNMLIDHYVEMKMSPGQVMLIIYLLRLSFHGRRPYPGQKKIAENLGVTERTVVRMIKELKEKGYMKTYTRYVKVEGEPPERRSNIYDLKGLLEKLKAAVKKEI